MDSVNPYNKVGATKKFGPILRTCEIVGLQSCVKEKVEVGGVDLDEWLDGAIIIASIFVAIFVLYFLFTWLPNIMIPLIVCVVLALALSWVWVKVVHGFTITRKDQN